MLRRARLRRRASTTARSTRARARGRADGIDVYFDNVGGPQLEAAIGALNRGGRIALCGAVSQYNATELAARPAQPVHARRQARHHARLHRRRPLRTARASSASEVGGLIADGRLTLAETVVEGGLEAAPGAFIDMLRGKHLGKVVVAL